MSGILTTLPSLARSFSEAVDLEQKDKREQDLKHGLINPRFPLSPSSFGGCSTRLAMNLSEFMDLGFYPKEMYDMRTIIRFSRGHSIEYGLIRQLKKYVPEINVCFEQQYCPMELTPDEKYIIGGSLDLILDLPGGAIVSDIKSKGTYFSAAYMDTFTEDFKKIGEMDGVSEVDENCYFIHDIYDFYEAYPTDNFISGYFLQLNAYACSPFGRNFQTNKNPQNRGIKGCQLLFECKNNHKFAELRWEPCEDLYNFALEKMQTIYKHVVTDKKPAHEMEPDFEFGSVMCKLCDRREQCHPGKKHPWTGAKKAWAKQSKKLDNFKDLEVVYKKYKNSLTGRTSCDKLEKDLIKQMTKSKARKIKFEDGKVYEVKALKTPQPHLELRPSK